MSTDDVVVRVEGLHKSFGRPRGAQGRRHGAAPRRGGRDLRPLRVGQVDAAALRELPRGPDRGHDRGAGIRLGGGHRTRRKREQIRQLRLHVGMVFQQFNLFPHMTVLENVMCGPAVPRRGTDKPRSTSAPGPARPGRPGRQGRRAPDPALRRSAAAGRHRAGPGDGARGDAVRRADVGARPRAHRRGAGGDEDARHRACT